MPRTVARFLFTFALLAGVLAPGADALARQMVSVERPEINMRDGPGTDHTALWRLIRGYPLEVFTPRTATPANVAQGLRNKNNQSPNIAVNIRNNPSLTRASLGGEEGLLKDTRDLVEPAGGTLNILWIRIFD